MNFKFREKNLTTVACFIASVPAIAKHFFLERSVIIDMLYITDLEEIEFFCIIDC